MSKFEKAIKKKNMANVQAKMPPNGKTIIKCQYDQRKEVAEWLGKHGKGGSTATCNDKRIGVSVVKGNHRDYSEEEVKAELEELVDFEIKNVRRFQAETKKGEKVLHWWVITTNTKDHILELKKVAKHYGSLRTPIVWEPYRSNRATRCCKCQQFNHLGRNCLFPTRCALCAGNRHL